MSYYVLPLEGNGLSLAHEVGHWLGLHHTYTTVFKEFTDPCDFRNVGDFVDDTPLQLMYPLHDEVYTNQTSWDSCPDQPGEDSF